MINIISTLPVEVRFSSEESSAYLDTLTPLQKTNHDHSSDLEVAKFFFQVQ